jgi:hypothetical protein
MKEPWSLHIRPRYTVGRCRLILISCSVYLTRGSLAICAVSAQEKSPLIGQPVSCQLSLLAHICEAARLHSCWRKYGVDHSRGPSLSEEVPREQNSGHIDLGPGGKNVWSTPSQAVFYGSKGPSSRDQEAGCLFKVPFEEETSKTAEFSRRI